MKITIFYILNILFVFSKPDLNKRKGKKAENIKPSLIKEINDVTYLQNYLKHKGKAIIEIYSPSCPHCVEFAPKYEEIAEIVYKLY